jgi:uncharacterized protein YqgV (UPF0045/DUF77 family)
MQARIRDNTENIKKCINNNQRENELIESLQKLIATSKANIENNNILIDNYENKNQKIEEKINNMIKNFDS